MTGDRHQEIERLFHQYGKGVGGYLLACTGDPELAEEITARVFLTVVRRLDQLRGPAPPWLWAIVRNELARHYRGRRPSPLDGETPAAGPSPVEQMERLQMQELLHSALDRLPADLHEIVYMKFFLKLRHAEIAEALGLTPTNVGVKVHRTLKELRRLMGGPEEGA